MKKIICFVLAFFLLMLSACGGSDSGSAGKQMKKIINEFKQNTKLLELKDTVIFYQTQRKNEKIYFQFNNNILLITSTSKKNNIEEIWYIYTNDNTLIEYKKYNDTKEISHKYLNQLNITNDNKKEYEKLMQIIEIYLKNKKSK